MWGLQGRLVTLVVVVSNLGHPLSVEVLRAVGLHLPPFVAHLAAQGLRNAKTS